MPEGRWSNYVLRRGEDFRRFWTDFLAHRDQDLLFVTGRGFAPRTCLGVEGILDAGGVGKRDCIAIAYEEGEHSASNEYAPQVERNWERLTEIITARGMLSTRTIQMVSEENR